MRFGSGLIMDFLCMRGKPPAMLGGFGVLGSGSKDTKAWPLLVAVAEHVLSYV